MSKAPLINFSLNEEVLKELYLKEIQKRLEEIEMEVMLLDSKQLCKMLNLSWPTIEKLFISDSNFPSVRVGKKWAFNRKEVQDYIDRWCMDVRKNGGIINL